MIPSKTSDYVFKRRSVKIKDHTGIINLIIWNDKVKYDTMLNKISTNHSFI